MSSSTDCKISYMHPFGGKDDLTEVPLPGGGCSVLAVRAPASGRCLFYEHHAICVIEVGLLETVRERVKRHQNVRRGWSTRRVG